MTTLLRNLLILLTFSVITLSAQEAETEVVADCVELNICLEKCADTDEACMDNCDATYTCPEDKELPEES